MRTRLQNIATFAHGNGSIMHMRMGLVRDISAPCSLDFKFVVRFCRQAGLERAVLWTVIAVQKGDRIYTLDHAYVYSVFPIQKALAKTH